MIRLMCGLTLGWALCAAVAFLLSGFVMGLPAGEAWGSVAGALFLVQYVCWLLAIVGLVVLLIGWPVALVMHHLKPKQPAPRYQGSHMPGYDTYQLDPATGIYSKVPPPC